MGCAFQQVFAYSVILYLHTQWYCQKVGEENGEGLDRGHRAGNKGGLQLDQIVQLYLLLSILIPWGVWGERACPFVSCVGSRQTALPSCFPSDSDHPNPSLPVDIDLISVLILGFPAPAFTVRPHHPLAPTCFWPPVCCQTPYRLVCIGFPPPLPMAP